jgi:hypothetical protein
MKYIVKNYTDLILFPTLINKSPDPSGKYFMNKMSVGNNITDASLFPSNVHPMIGIPYMLIMVLLFV